jgi:hypothetical protein
MAKPTTKDYGYCETCKTYFDIYKGDGLTNDHRRKDGCTPRYATPAELPALIKSCKDDGCEHWKGE